MPPQKRPTLAGLAHRVDALEVERNILDVLYRYCHALDAGDADDWLTCFARDGVLDVHFVRRTGGQNHRERGHQALAVWFKRYTGARKVQQRHLLSDIRIILGGGSAEAISYFATVEERDGEPVLVASGRYSDRLARERGKWVIVERRVEVEA